MTLARDAYRRARALLAANRECLDDLAANALERETLTREDLDEIFAAHELHGLAEPHGSGAALVGDGPRSDAGSISGQTAIAERRRQLLLPARAARSPGGSTASARSACSTGSGRC